NQSDVTIYLHGATSTRLYRYSVDEPTSKGKTFMAGGSIAPITLYGLTAGTHTLFIDELGANDVVLANDSIDIVIDKTPPGAPSISGTGCVPCNNDDLFASWSSAEQGAVYRWRVDNGAWSDVSARMSFHQPPTVLLGPHNF